MNTKRDTRNPSRTTSAVAAAAVLLLATLPAFANPFRVIVAPFSNESYSGFLNLEEGVASLLSAQLDTAGFDVVDWDEVKATLQDLSLAPDLAADLLVAGDALGAEFVVEGTVHSISMKEASLYIGFLRFSGGSANVELAANAFCTETGALVGSYSGAGYWEGDTGFTVELGDLFLAAEEAAVCTGGLRAARNGYGLGQPVTISYRNPSIPTGWYSVEVSSSGGRFLRWLGWEYVKSDTCVQWTWDQTDSLGTAVPPGIYSARISNGDAVLEYTNFQIRPDTEDTAETRQITVAEPAFSQTIVGSALSCALTELASELTPDLMTLAFEIETRDVLAVSVQGMQTGSQEEDTVQASQSAIEGQVAAILPDGRLAITLGTTSGIAIGDALLVLSTDPTSDGEPILKGEIVITEVREHVSYAVPIDEADVAVGDVVRVP